MKSIELMELYAERGGIISNMLNNTEGVLFCQGIFCKRCPVQEECKNADFEFGLPCRVSKKELLKFKKRNPEYFI